MADLRINELHKQVNASCRSYELSATLSILSFIASSSANLVIVCEDLDRVDNSQKKYTDLIAREHNSLVGVR